ncbi:type II toxin-antitoxin system ChpB family toxin [Methylophaga thalassica]|uniref:type II toxin-antitoxin system ChpB family toxin n=1 Tax=Methylophaga TaxID=40222 RepID=UPI002E7BB8B3|nr:type II toxin-antitoxin system ChpB family toxin [Methylophaga thalassica]WVI86420.1 type II toxin-antitoxin system ChpB family toxin [Methylophaga thalassica]
MAFKKGDIVKVSLNPTIGREQQGDFRPCLVLSPQVFNKLGMTLIAPITQGGNHARIEGFTVSLMGAGTDTQGVVLVNSVRMIDLETRKAVQVEQVPSYIIDEALAILASIIEA